MSRFILLEKYDNISENFMLKNSKCVINICRYAPRRMYTHNTHPCFEWYIPSKSPILRELLNVESGNIYGGFSCIFGRLKVWICKIMAYKGWAIINWCMNGIHEWDWVHERFLCPRAAPSGINNRSYTQSHSWTPNSWTTFYTPQYNVYHKHRYKFGFEIRPQAL